MKTLALLHLAIGAVLATEPDFSAAATNPAMTPVTGDPKLPRVLLIGDSISIGYTLPVRKLLAGRANVHRIPENGGPTPNGLARLAGWLGSNHWDVIHFNWGLHDLKLLPDGPQQVPLEAYEQNLETLVGRLRATGAALIWASTTPVPAQGKLSPPRRAEDVVAYNATARRVMERHGVTIDDLHALAAPQLEALQIPANVHFKPQGSEALAEPVAQSILAALKQRQTKSTPP